LQHVNGKTTRRKKKDPALSRYRAKFKEETSMPKKTGAIGIYYAEKEINPRN
jgi:hypothetical protein